MALIQVRGVDDDVVEALKQRASARGQSLNGYLRVLLTETARRPTRADVLARVAARGERSTVSSVAVVRADRDAR